MAPALRSGGKKAAKAKPSTFVIDCSKPVDDKILELAAFEKYLADRIKVAGKAGALGDAVKVSKDRTKITVVAEGAFSKRYLKYLTKKFLKKKEIRDWLHVIASNASTYELRYFNINQDEEEEEDAQE